jgi:hypothetical protein
MSVFREVVIRMGGDDYTITPSNRLLRRIESKGKLDNPRFNLVEVLFYLQTSAGSMPDMAFILSELVTGSGGKMTEDQALAAIVGMEVDDLQALKLALCACIMPEPNEKKPDAPGKEAA